MEDNSEPMDVDTSFMTDDGAKGSYEDNHVHIPNNKRLNTQAPHCENQSGSSTTGIDIFSEQERSKMKERAKRFGLQDNPENSYSEKGADSYSSIGIIDESEYAKKNQLNVLHMRGTEDMSTKNVIEYFEEYAPASTEWINDVSCIKGLLTESRKRMYKQVHSSKKQLDKEMLNEEGERKRLKNPWGTLSETWGQNDSIENNVPRTELTSEPGSGVKKRLGIKHRAKEGLIPSISPLLECTSQSSSESSDEEWCKRSKVLRMRMHADDEEEKMLKKRIKKRTQEMHASMESKSNDLRLRLSNTQKMFREPIQVVVTNTPIKWRLSHSCTLKEEGDHDETQPEQEEGEWIEEGEELEKQLEGKRDEESDDTDVSEIEIQGPKGSVIKVVPPVKPRVASTVWARLNNTKSETKMEDRCSSKDDLKGSSKGDLRSRLGYHNRGRSPLRIEVKNDQYAEECSSTE